MEELATEYSGRVTFAGFDAHQNFETPGALGVLGFPTLVFFKDGNEVGRIFGAMKKGRLIEAIRKNLGI
jgi:thioredoxin 1